MRDVIADYREEHPAIDLSFIETDRSELMTFFEKLIPPPIPGAKAVLFCLCPHEKARRGGRAFIID